MLIARGRRGRDDRPARRDHRLRGRRHDQRRHRRRRRAARVAHGHRGRHQHGLVHAGAEQRARRRRRVQGSGPPTKPEMAVTPRLFARLELTYADGTTDAIVSDRSFRAKDGPTITDNWYSGTDYDARAVQPGWDEPGADLSAGWETRRSPRPLAADQARVARGAADPRTKTFKARRSRRSAPARGRSTSARTSPACRACTSTAAGPRGHDDPDRPGRDLERQRHGQHDLGRRAHRHPRHLHDRRRPDGRRSPRSSCTTASSTCRSAACRPTSSRTRTRSSACRPTPTSRPAARSPPTTT